MEEIIFALFVYDSYNHNVIRIHAEKIYNNNQLNPFYEYETPKLKTPKSFNSLSFVCGLAGIVACSAFSAMLFAFFPVNIVAGMTCSMAFNYVCSHN